MSETIRKKQLALKQVRLEWGHSDMEYRDFMQRIFGVRSFLDLPERAIDELIEIYQAMIKARKEYE